MERIIDSQLDVLRDKLLLLGGTTEKAVHRAMQSLTQRDSDLAQQVIDDDKVINKMEVDIDRLSVEILALQQPAAHDLRFVISVAKITPILERIADHAANIAEAAIILNNEPEVRSYVDFPKMAEIAGEMLQAALDAFTSEDAETSRKVIKRDEEIDKIYDKVFGELIEMMIRDPDSTPSAAHLLFVAKHLERIGDYVKDICELNVYLTEAAFIKHKKSIKKLKKQAKREKK
ncbi:MAG: phosphate signaling complex protein PhoU [Pyrinomonadaceae bacterium]|nr:phosphate signaling complex protein PhoU [Pyrinomonadaceae bacterium]